MIAESKLAKYYASPKDIRKQLPYLWMFVGIFIFSLLIASGFQNEIVRNIMLFISLCYPLLIIFLLLACIPSLHYYQIDSRGLYITFLGVFHKRIYWSEIEKIGPAALPTDVEALGFMYSSSVNRYIMGRKTRVKTWGWDELVSNAFTKNGTSLIKEINKYFKKYQGTVGK